MKQSGKQAVVPGALLQFLCLGLQGQLVLHGIGHQVTRCQRVDEVWSQPYTHYMK